MNLIWIVMWQRGVEEVVVERVAYDDEEKALRKAKDICNINPEITAWYKCLEVE